MPAVKRLFDISVSLVGLGFFRRCAKSAKAQGSEMRYRIDRSLNERIVVTLIFSRLLFDWVMRTTC